MWLHVPTTLLASVPDTAESNLDSEKSSLLEQSAMWKSKSASQQSWQRVWKRDTSIRRLSGLTLKHSILSRGVEKLTSSLVASLASPSQSQERSSEKMTQETSGQTQPDLFGGLGHQLSFSKMSPEFSSITSVQSDPNYERWVTRLRKDYFQRQKQAHPTNVSESLSWPTPAEFQERRSLVDGENKSLSTGVKFGISLTQSARENWPTPRASDNEGGIPSNVELSEGSFSRTNADGVRWGVKLKDATANWTTPLADDTNTRKNKFAQGGTPLSMQASNWPTPGANEDRADNYTIETSQRHLEEGRQVHLAQVVKMNWPTPKAGNPGSRKPGTGGKVLNEEAKKWPTPAQRDYKGGSIKTVRYKNGKPVRISNTTGENHGLTLDTASVLSHSTLQDQETETDGHTCSPSCRRLNPLFAEHLMGLPLGWTCVSEPLATESFQRWQLGLSAYLARS